MTSELEWRRRWKPDLRARPWRIFRIEETNFLIKTKFFDAAYQILITDYNSVWIEELDEDAIKKRSKKLNPSVEAPVSKLLDLIRENIETPKKGTDYSVAYKALDDGSDQEKILLTVDTKLAGLPFVWKFYSDPASKKQVSDHMICPLLAMVGELHRRQEELFKLLKNKDKEIEDHRIQGHRVTRKHLETVPFDETIFDSNMLETKGFEEGVKHLGLTAFAESGQQLYTQIMTKYSWLNRDPTQDTNKRKRTDLEGESLLDDEYTTPTGPSVSSWSNRVPPSLASPGTSPSKKSPAKRPAATSPAGSPAKKPANTSNSNENSPIKNVELMRREALEKKLQEEEEKKMEKQTVKKKKKLKI